jgi:glycerol-3-phosphate dehydrogenase (NAD(P)+)
MLGKGYFVQSAQLELDMVAEGFNASKCIFTANEKVGAKMPIAKIIYQVLWQQMPAAEGFKY